MSNSFPINPKQHWIPLRFAGFVVIIGIMLIFFSYERSAAQGPKTKEQWEMLKKAKSAKDSMRAYQLAASWAMREGAEKLSLQYAQNLMGLARRRKNLDKQAVANFYIANYYFFVDKNDSGNHYALACIDKYNEAGQKGIFYTYALNIIAAYYLDKADGVNALKYGQRQMDVAIEVKDTASLANSYTMLCAIYNTLGNMQQSIIYAEKALQLNMLAGDTRNRVVVLTNLAGLYIGNNQFQDALPILKMAQHLAEVEFKNTSDRINTNILLGESFSGMKRYDSAANYFNKADQLISTVERPELKIRFWTALAKSYQAQGNEAAAVEILDKGIPLAKQIGLIKPYIEGLQLKAEALAKQGNHKEAYQLFKQYHSLNDSISNTAVQTNIAELQEKYESGKKDQAILQQQALNELLRSSGILKDQKLRNELLLKQALQSRNLLALEQIEQDSALNAALGRENVLKKKQLGQAKTLNANLAEENELKAKDLKNQRLITGLLAAGFISILLFAFILIRQNRKQKAANKIIAQQSEKLVLMMKELHHRVKNNLQIVSSLLSLQSFRLGEGEASKAMRESQQRIEAMSMIHQRLYTRENISEINMNGFIADLIASLQSSYGFKKNDIAVHLNITDELLNVDQAIPLSLIINELATNAFKYAYAEVEKAEIRAVLIQNETSIALEIADNGKGIDLAKWNSKGGSFGKELVQTFVKQLGGTLEIKVDNGTIFNLTFPRKS